MVSDSPQQAIDTLISARWVLPVEGDTPALEQHSIAIDAGRILAVMPTADANRQFSPREHHNLPQHALMPGLVNAHGHAGMSLLRGIADDLALQTWLQEHIWPLEQRWVASEFVRHGTDLAIAEMLRGGTTCFADMYFFPDAAAKAAVDANIRVQLAAPVLDFPTAWGHDSDDYIHKAAQLHDEYRNSQLISVAFGPHAPYTVSDAPLQKLATLAEELDIPIHMHIHETAQEVSDALASQGRRPLQRLREIGLLSPRLIAVHATQLSEEEIGWLAESGVSVAHCPHSNLKLASGFCPVHALQQAGVNVALGTDGAASNNDLDMFAEMQSAALLAKAVAGDASALPAWRALQMATLDGARAMGLDQHIGSLTPGKFADITAVDMRALNCTPIYNVISHLVYSTQASQVSDVWIGGRQVLANGQLQTLNEQAIRRTTADWQQKLTGEQT
jgi:5-methylthioadenosine/S-adenosylhomocysteine deaminase